MRELIRLQEVKGKHRGKCDNEEIKRKEEVKVIRGQGRKLGRCERRIRRNVVENRGDREREKKRKIGIR